MEIRLFFTLKVDTISWIKYNATPKSSKKLLNNPVPERGNYGVGVNNLNTIELDVRYCVWWLGKLPRVNIFIWNLCKSQPSLELQRKRRYWSHIRGRRKLHKIHDIENPVGNQKSELQQILFEDFVGGLCKESIIEMFYLNSIEQLFLFVEQLDQLEVCLVCSRLLTGIPILAAFQNFRWNNNKKTLTRFGSNRLDWWIFYLIQLQLHA